MTSNVPSVVKPPPGNPRFPLFDGLRAVAVIAVVLSHVSFIVGVSREGGVGALFSNLDVGVTIFFVISGFLLYRPFIASDFSGKPMATMRYFRRRVLRIVPLYWVVLTILALVESSVVSGVFTQDWWRYYFFLHTYASSPYVRVGGLTQTWSLNIEVAFYIALPIYALLARRFLGGSNARRRMWRELTVLATVAALSIVLRALTVPAGNARFVESLPSYAGWFAVGMALAVVSACVGRVARADAIAAALGRNTLVLAALALLVYVSLGTVAQGTANGFREQNLATDLVFFILTAIVAGCLASIAIFGTTEGRFKLPERLMASRPMVSIGLISYGIFLWHMAVIVIVVEKSDLFASGLSLALRAIAATLLTALVVLPLAELTYYLIERPALSFKEPRKDEVPVAET